MVRSRAKGLVTVLAAVIIGLGSSCGQSTGQSEIGVSDDVVVNEGPCAQWMKSPYGEDNEFKLDLLAVFDRQESSDGIRTAFSEVSALMMSKGKPYQARIDYRDKLFGFDLKSADPEFVDEVRALLNGMDVFVDIVEC